ncbi:FAD/NAD(P)-binding domain-containing protein [Tilletiaria anomala UBC 951]|uniref:NADH:ubiquinone reductase (non-electrogenic) n=1 Tax=Tilletiaria anomala (strain ATCC 24038 / CBS 436.72 / UBC 951) TaxID=1037660 RepID=A0A066VUL5_TILAU|nr:FAD/NAD(P)-binding domain-containing protein [Tilletiaria anomala UBC 951]KDN43963.1 FAD/NAD(P)-binding domain-containing protein [Tilletiaria anomala UBC 951]
MSPTGRSSAMALKRGSLGASSGFHFAHAPAPLALRLAGAGLATRKQETVALFSPGKQQQQQRTLFTSRWFRANQAASSSSTPSGAIKDLSTGLKHAPDGAAAAQTNFSSVSSNGNGNGNGGGSRKKKKGFFRRVRNGLGWTVVLGTGTVAYYIYDTRNPPEQLPQDPSKKNIVVLGSGWAATSFLKNVDTEQYNVTVISPHNYFLFTPLLPSVTVGTLDGRSIAQPTRHTTRFKRRSVQVIEAEAETVDVARKTVTFEDKSEIKGSLGKVTIPYDYLVYGVGSENQTFGIEGVKRHACFLKELTDAEQIRNRLMDCVESAAIAGTSKEDIDRLLHMVVVGGGPTGVEYAAELRDFVRGDLKKWYPEVADRVRVTLIEALPSILPSFSKTLIDYTISNFKEQEIELKLKHMVKDVDAEHVHVQDPSGERILIPYGLLVWAAGNTARPITRDLMAQLPATQTNRRGLTVDEHMRLHGAEDAIFALGDATATQYAPTAQAASQQGAYLARVFNQLAKVDVLEGKIDAANRKPLTDAVRQEILALEKQLNRASKIKPFHYTHQGSLAYIGKDKAIADIPVLGGDFASGGVATYIFWQSAYWSMLFSIRNRALVATDWLKVALFGRDVSRE